MIKSDRIRKTCDILLEVGSKLLQRSEYLLHTGNIADADLMINAHKTIMLLLEETGRLEELKKANEVNELEREAEDHGD